MDIHQLTRIFCEIDDFCKEFSSYMKSKLLPRASSGERGPRCKLSDSEIMVILIWFQSSGFRNFKLFYNGFVCQYCGVCQRSCRVFSFIKPPFLFVLSLYQDLVKQLQ